jgi:DNA-binding NarL/FixJ family response regulator
MNKISQSDDIIIADTQILAVEGLKALLGKKYNISGVVTSKIELFRTLKDKAPRLLILDYVLLDFEGYDDLREIKRAYPGMGIIILTNNPGRNEITEYHNIGINNILHKLLETNELYECIESILKGRKFYSGVVLDMLFESNDKKNTAATAQLTASEIEIVRLIAEGLTNKEIASRKILSIHTIMTHRKNILRKLGVSNASELIMYAIKSGIIDNIEYHI